MQHYFIDKAHKESDYFYYNDSICGLDLRFKSVDSVFSKDKIDDGTRVLLNTVYNNYSTLEGKVLDVGCGLGVIGITLKKLYPNSEVFMCDINKTCVDLSNENCEINNVECHVQESNLYESCSDKYNYIITNPPIKVGKEILFRVVSDGYKYLLKNGEIILVIRKSHGEESMKKHMQSVFGNCEILKRDKGYYILKSIKKED